MRMRYAYITLAFLVVFGVSILGFRDTVSTRSPIDVFPEWAFPGMKHQPKYKNQGMSKFFADGRADRPIPAGTVASSYGVGGHPLRDDDHLFRGKTATGDFARGFPAAIKIDNTFIQRGRERYNIYCLPCHGALGDGMGVTKAYGMGATPSYHIDRLRIMPEGEIFNTISNGKGNMQSYADKLEVSDRWAVILYVRALQRAQTGALEDVPSAHKSELGIK